jgi:ribosome maturation factor RimP
VATTAERLGRIVAPVAGDLGLSIYDVEEAGGTLRVLLDRPGGIDVDALTTATRRISAAMDDDGSFPATATLEVSSPGLERKLRTPEHFAGAVGDRVKVKLRAGVDGDRRLDGVLSAAGADQLTVTPDGADPRTVALSDVETAHTEFVWGPAPKPGGKNAPKKSASRKSAPKKSASQKSAPDEAAADHPATDHSAPETTEATP